MVDTKELTFPALVFCGWFSNFNLEETIFECKFNSKPCQKTIEKVVIIGYGQSLQMMVKLTHTRLQLKVEMILKRFRFFCHSVS